MAGLTSNSGLPASSLDCPIRGGIRTLYATPIENIASWSISATLHEFTTLTFSGSDYFQEIEFKRFTANLQQADTRNEESFAVSNQVTISIQLDGLDSAQLFALEEIKAHCKLCLVARTFNDQFVVVGYDSIFGAGSYANYGSLESDSGSDVGDLSVGTLQFTARMQELCRIFTGDPAGGSAPPDATEIATFLTTGSY